MNKPQFEIGDIVNCWVIIRVSKYSETYIYSLHNNINGGFLVVDETTLINWLNKKSA